MLHRTYLPAKTIETMLEEHLTDCEETVYSRPYANGREVGFVFYRAGREHVFVAQDRHSNEILVTTYAAARRFDRTARDETLDHILTQLNVLDPSY